MRLLAKFTPVEDKKKSSTTYEYTRKLTYRYTTWRAVNGEVLSELPDILFYTPEYNDYEVTQTFRIKDKTFYEYENENKHDNGSLPSRCIDMNYKPEDFQKNLPGSYLKIKESSWDRNKGVYSSINGMAKSYKRQIENSGLLPTGTDKKSIEITATNIQSINKGLKNFYDKSHRFFFLRNNRKIAKWIYWSLMESLYDETIKKFRETMGKNTPQNFNIHQECHRIAIATIQTHLGPDVVQDIYKGGGIFGRNQTVAAMQAMGIMDDGKYTSRNGLFSGSRFCFLSGQSRISPSGKEATLRSGNNPDIWYASGTPPKGARQVTLK